MPEGQQYFVLIGAIVGIIFEVGALCAVGYAGLRVATRLIDMRREIEELKIVVRQIDQRV